MTLQAAGRQETKKGQGYKDFSWMDSQGEAGENTQKHKHSDKKVNKTKQ